jgi:apolipoprotein N-acyltransferase
MNSIPLILQGALFGFVATLAFPGLTWEFWAIVFANSLLVVAYGVARSYETGQLLRRG